MGVEGRGGGGLGGERTHYLFCKQDQNLPSRYKSLADSLVPYLANEFYKGSITKNTNIARSLDILYFPSARGHSKFLQVMYKCYRNIGQLTYCISRTSPVTQNSCQF